ncbi:helix-turn-helix domain-containing protein [Paenibacillus ferrarius]|uniref:helix-turn-helix domain-containing protein n=1 Tax=Paenibacillus ferrarius TaxID=1469647 RepID=UPI003D2BF1EE
MNQFSKHGPIYHLPPIGEPPPLSVQFLGINYCEHDYRNVRELASITVVGYVLSGQGSLQVNAQFYIAGEGDVFILPAGCSHDVAPDPRHTGQWSYIWLNVSGSWILKLLDAYQLTAQLVTPGSGLGPLFHEAIEGAVHRSVNEMQAELQVMLMRIIVTLSDLQRQRGALLSPPVQAIQHYLDNHILQGFDPLELAEQVGMSARHMNRLFRKEIGTTVYHYILGKKMESAKLMLLDTPLTISEIGYRLGYNDPHYFSNLFQSKIGVRPSDFRKRLEESR